MYIYIYRYFVVAEAIACGYTLVVLILSSKSLFWRLIVILDAVREQFQQFNFNFLGLVIMSCCIVSQVMTAVLTSSISAALAIAHVGKKGNSHAGWLPICGQVPKFCDHVTGALVCGFVAAIVYVLLLIYSLHSVLGPVFGVKP